ncbi:hypothetical protein [Archangium sp.]|uniref:hypothetical protein n=1 Tax=Archangium sp. TaxID=1872627 RepID=UPI00389AA771
MTRDWKRTGKHLGLLLVWAVLAGCGPEEDASRPVQDGDTLGASAKADSRGETRWVRRVHSAGEADTPVAVVHDAQGNVLMLGNYHTPVDLGEGPEGNPAGATVLSVSRYSPGGGLQWTRILSAPPRAGTSPYVRGQALAVDSHGALLLLGLQSGGLELGGSVLPPGAFLARLEVNGTPSWARPLPTSATELAVDERGNLTLAGVLSGRVDFGKGPITGTGNPYLVQFDAAGALRWVYVDSARGVPMDLAQDDAGNFYLSGGGFLPPSPLLSPFVTRVSSEGEYLWTRRLEGASGLAMSVAAHGGHVVVSGSFTGTLVFRGETLRAPTARGFALAYDRDGNERWGFLLGSSWGLVAMDQGSGVVVAGRYNGGEDFGLGQGALEGFPGTNNLYVLRLQRTTGQLQWMHSYPSASAQPADLSVTRQGLAALTGTFRARVDFGTGPMDPLPGGNAFLLQLER